MERWFLLSSDSRAERESAELTHQSNDLRASRCRSHIQASNHVLHGHLLTDEMLPYSIAEPADELCSRATTENLQSSRG